MSIRSFACGTLPRASLPLGVLLMLTPFPLRGSAKEPAAPVVLSIGGRAQAYYSMDERIQWSGVEQTFGAEARLEAALNQTHPWGRWSAEGEFYLNQPFGKTLLLDENRIKYKPNFTREPFEISRLALRLQHGGWTWKAGKMETPFGRCRVPVFFNSKWDAPFIRTEAILWRETGLFAVYRRGPFSLEAGIANGEEDRDTNSESARLARIGLEGETWEAGLSVKSQDGISSERQKRFNGHTGMDFQWRRGRVSVYGEIIRDEYGFRHPLADEDIFWERSLYERDVFFKGDTPVTGVGGYVGTGIQFDAWSLDLILDAYRPEKIGQPLHDQDVRRALLKGTFRPWASMTAFGVVLLENHREVRSWQEGRKGLAVALGAAYLF